MDRETIFILSKFSEYYRRAELKVKSIEKREFGIGIENKIDIRHLSFESESDLKAYLATTPPFYVSYSVAYYLFPKAVPMEKKEWQKADLVFDLDYGESQFLSKIDFEIVKDSTIRLIEDFLISDFGISKNEISVNFSGNRGFHVHVFSEDFSQFRSEERKELIEYIKGIGLSEDLFFYKDEKIKGKVNGPKLGDGGYRGRLVNKALLFLSTPYAFQLFKDANKIEAAREGIKEGNWSIFFSNKKFLRELKQIIEKELPLFSVNIDSSVTQDITRLIRLPNSIHGSTGLIAKKISLSELDNFNPYNSVAFSSQPIKIRALQDIEEMEFENERKEKIRKNEEKEVSENYGIFLALKGAAKIIF